MPFTKVEKIKAYCAKARGEDYSEGMFMQVMMGYGGNEDKALEDLIDTEGELTDEEIAELLKVVEKGNQNQEEYQRREEEKDNFTLPPAQPGSTREKIIKILQKHGEPGQDPEQVYIMALYNYNGNEERFLEDIRDQFGIKDDE